MSNAAGIHEGLIPRRYSSAVRIWLLCCIFMVVAMVAVGGLTRLTESGLSMVNWHPIHGTLPPMNEAEWQEELQNYRTSPQYQQVNKGMSVTEFKQIFWLEYIHRVLGRLVGMIFFLPLVAFMTLRALPFALSARLVLIFLLGGGQGLMGWYMVQSGLADVPWVSPLRLAMHLGLALIIFGLLWWHYLILKMPALGRRSDPLSVVFTVLALILLFAQAMLGALVAGMDAGLLYDTFPKMNGEWMPPETFSLFPWYLNLVENPTAVHFVHRAGALVVTAVIAVLCVVMSFSRIQKCHWRIFHFLGLFLVLQVVLGAMTVMYHVPILLASLHQIVALFLFAALLSLLYSLRYRREDEAFSDRVR